MYRRSLSYGLVVVLLVLTNWPSSAAEEERESDEGRITSVVRELERERLGRLGLAALDRFLETFNSRDLNVWAKSLNFPHVRPSAGNFALNMTIRDWLPRRAGMFEPLMTSGWDRTQWDSRQIVHVSPDKMHIAGKHSRVRKNGEKISSNQVVYIVTRQADTWGVQARFGTGRFEARGQMDEVAQSAQAAIEAYFEAFNTHDPEVWANTLHFPQVRLSASGIDFWQTREDFLSGTEPGRQRTWARTKLDSSDLLKTGPAGVNAAVRFVRLNAQGDSLSSYEAIYLVTRRDGRWAVQSRSSYAP